MKLMITFRNFLAGLIQDFPGGQKALSEKTGISSSILGRIAKGEINAEPHRVEAISKALPAAQGLELIRHWLRGFVPQWASSEIEILVGGYPNILQETPAAYGEQKDEDVEIALNVLRNQAARDQDTREWLLLTANLLVN